MSLNAWLQQLFELGDKRDDVHYGFIKQVLLMASSLFGILVSLHKVPAPDKCIRTAFALALALLSLGILLLTIALSAQLAVRKALFVKLKAEISLHIRDSNYQPKIVSGEPSKIYKFCEAIGYLSLVLSVVGLALYAVMIA